MPTPYGCALDDAYANWGFKQPNTDIKQTLHSHPSLKPHQQDNHQQDNHKQEKVVNNHFEMQQDNHQDVYLTKDTNIRNFCPNCQNCLNANDVLQQRIIEQTIYPRPRWEPQNPHAYTPYDPFNRYWLNNVAPTHREDFGNVWENFDKGKNNMTTQTLLQVILFILIALFVIQLVECLYVRYT